MPKILSRCPLLLAAALAAVAAGARAEVGEVRLAQQHGIAYLPLVVMERHKLLEKHLAAAGLAKSGVRWWKFSSGSAMNDALMAGDLHFASGGVGPMATLWARTRGTLDVKAVAAVSAMPLYLVTRNPAANSVRDFSAADRIAVPAIRISTQAVVLQMAAEQAFGAGQHGRLDAQTVSMSHPDALAALLSGGSEVTAHFSSPPFQSRELAAPGVHRVLSSYDVLGGPATTIVVWTSGRFCEANPRTCEAFVAALRESVALSRSAPRAAAEAYAGNATGANSAPEIERLLGDPEIQFSVVPRNVMKYVDFMYRTGALPARPASWRELFLPYVHDSDGS
jgi:NitT/TauT family transport system substrate-binding protein